MNENIINHQPNSTKGLSSDYISFLVKTLSVTVFILFYTFQFNILTQTELTGNNDQLYDKIWRKK